MKKVMLNGFAFFTLLRLLSCADLNSFDEPEPTRLTPLPPDDRGELLMSADIVNDFQWAHLSSEIYAATQNGIISINTVTKTVRTVVNSVEFPAITFLSSDDRRLYFTERKSGMLSLSVIPSSGGISTLILEASDAPNLISPDERFAIFSGVLDSVFSFNLSSKTKRFIGFGWPVVCSPTGEDVILQGYDWASGKGYFQRASVTGSSTPSLILTPDWDESADLWSWDAKGLRVFIWKFSHGSTGLFMRDVFSGSKLLLPTLNVDFIHWTLVSVSADGEQLASWVTRCVPTSTDGCGILEMKLHLLNLTTVQDTTIASFYRRYYMDHGVTAFSDDASAIAYHVKSGLYMRVLE